MTSQRVQANRRRLTQYTAGVLFTFALVAACTWGPTPEPAFTGHITSTEARP